MFVRGILRLRDGDLEALAGIQQNGDRPFIDQLHAHHCLEAAGFAAQTRCLNSCDKIFIQPPGVLRRRGRVERRALAAADVPIQSELRDRKHAAANVLYATIHLAVLVFEDAEARNLFRQIVCVVLGIFDKPNEFLA